MRRFLIAIVAITAAINGACGASACGPNTVALLESVQKMEAPPVFRCGTDFNDVMARVHDNNWKAALAAYEAHLTHLGKWQAGSEDAKATLEFLRKLAGQ